MTKVIGDYSAAGSIDGSTNYLLIQPGSASTPYNKINRNTLLGVNGQPADLTTVQTVQNKVLNNTNTVTVKDTLLTIQDNSDTSKQAQFELSGLTTATTRTYTMPDASTTLVGTGTTQTLTNKTLTSPAITGGTYDNGTITVDSIGGHTSANVVTIAGLQINNGALNTNNSVVTASVTDGAITPAKLLAGTGTGWSWQSFTPTYTNLTVGNGTHASKYVQTGKTVIAKFDFTFGNTSSVSGSINASLPVTAVTYGAGSPFGYGLAINTGTAEYNLTAEFQSTTAVIFYAQNVSSTYSTVAVTSSTIPFAWANGSRLSVVLIYEAA